MARRTFEELLSHKVVPIVNENDVISMDELAYGTIGENDTLAAYVADLVGADLLILMSDIEGLYTDDPRKNEKVRFIHTVAKIDESLEIDTLIKTTKIYANAIYRLCTEI